MPILDWDKVRCLEIMRSIWKMSINYNWFHAGFVDLFIREKISVVIFWQHLWETGNEWIILATLLRIWWLLTACVIFSLQIWIFKWISEISKSIKESNSGWQKMSSDFEKWQRKTGEIKQNKLLGTAHVTVIWFE
jgi:hypothetical protein